MACSSCGGGARASRGTAQQPRRLDQANIDQEAKDRMPRRPERRVQANVGQFPRRVTRQR